MPIDTLATWHRHQTQSDWLQSGQKPPLGNVSFREVCHDQSAAAFV
jgi:hypothetical protein